MLRQRLDRHLSIQPRVVGEIHDTHPPASEFPKDFKGAKSRLATQRHRRASFCTTLGHCVHGRKCNTSRLQAIPARSATAYSVDVVRLNKGFLISFESA